MLRVKEERPGTHVLWFSGNNAGDLQQSISTLNDVLNLTEGEGRPQQFYARFREWLRDPANGEWLIVLDGFDLEQRFPEVMDAELLLKVILSWIPYCYLQVMNFIQCLELYIA